MVNDEFQKDTDDIINALVEVGAHDKVVRRYKRCYDQLADYLALNKIPFSAEAAEEWITSISGQSPPSYITSARTALDRLCRFYATGEISLNGFSMDRRLAELTPEFQDLITQLVAEQKNVLSESSVQARRSKYSVVLMRMQKLGCASVSDISYDVLFQLCEAAADKETLYTCRFLNTCLKKILQHLYDYGLCPFGFTLFVDTFTHAPEYLYLSVRTEQIEVLRTMQGYTLEEYLGFADAVVEKYRNAGYSKVCISTIFRITRRFYLFLDINKLAYTPTAGTTWAEMTRTVVSITTANEIRRTLYQVKLESEGKKIDLSAVYPYKEPALAGLPEWCRIPIEQYLEEQHTFKRAKSTIAMQRAACCRFCIFLVKEGLDSFQQLDVGHIKKFILTDHHKTAAGKGAYNSRIRNFLYYLSMKKYLSNPFLFLSIPRSCAPKETLVITLTKEEQEELNKKLEPDNTELSYREKAMIRLGLDLGLRGVDITNLVFDDIDWDDPALRIVQAKTGYDLYLPLPTDTANAIFHYIMEERPESDSHRIFLRERAPHCPLKSRVACNSALSSALPDRHVPGSGFHVTRKTFATNRLKAGADVNEVKEALGHQDMSNVHKYLSLDEERMRKCGISLKEAGIPMKGDFFDEQK